MALLALSLLLWQSECMVASGRAFVPVLMHRDFRPRDTMRQACFLRRAAVSGVAGLVAGDDLLEYGGRIATLDESMALFRIEQKRADMGEPAGAAWLRQLTPREMLRLCRARQRNVYGHDWRLQGSDGKEAVVKDAWALATAHARWRQDMRMDDLLRECRFAQAAEPLSEIGAVGLVSPRVVWFKTAADLPRHLLPPPRVVPGPVLWVRVPRAEADGDVEVTQKLMFEVAAACEWANAFLGVGVSEQASVLVDVSQADDTAVRAFAGVVWEQIATPRFKAMALQMIGSPQVASHPPPSMLPLDHYPALFSQIVFLVPPPTSTAAENTTQRLCRAMDPAWRFVEKLANVIPLAGPRTCATRPLGGEVEGGGAE